MTEQEIQIEEQASLPPPIQPELVGVPAPEGYDGPWPKPDMDGGDPSSWT
jgi:hypothetical protein